jgi:hypothetical protein
VATNGKGRRFAARLLAVALLGAACGALHSAPRPHANAVPSVARSALPATPFDPTAPHIAVWEEATVLAGIAAGAMAYDAAHGQLVLFGGTTQDVSETAETWTWSSATWTRATPAASPSPQVRTGHAMAYDAMRGRIVLFGGGSDPTGTGMPLMLDDTWTWDGTSWTRMTPTNAPDPRGGHAIAYDAAHGSVVMFGGGLQDNTTANDTWTWDGTNWKLAFPTNVPPGRSSHSMAYDAAHGRVVMFGGFSGSNGVLSDTWIWDGTNWTAGSPVHVPGPRYFHGLAEDPAKGQVILYGGNNTAGPRYDDTWSWNGTDWTLQNPTTTPGGLVEFQIAYDAATSSVVVFGGMGGPDALITSDTWEWNGTNWVNAGGSAPNHRVMEAMAYDDAHDEVVLFGGTDERGIPYDDTWTWNGTMWREHAPSASPSARGQSAMVFDAARQEVVLFGGSDSGSNVMSDTWTWDGTTWKAAAPPTSPPGRFAHAMAYDAAHARTVLFGGVSPVGILNDTWTWDGTTWTQAMAFAAPLGHVGYAMAYDATRKEVVLFGALNEMLDDTWTWTARRGTKRPRRRHRPGAATRPWSMTPRASASCSSAAPRGASRCKIRGRGRLDVEPTHLPVAARRAQHALDGLRCRTPAGRALRRRRAGVVSDRHAAPSPPRKHVRDGRGLRHGSLHGRRVLRGRDVRDLRAMQRPFEARRVHHGHERT